jgi:hypothetical protein
MFFVNPDGTAKLSYILCYVDRFWGDGHYLISKLAASYSSS